MLNVSKYNLPSGLLSNGISEYGIKSISLSSNNCRIKVAFPEFDNPRKMNLPLVLNKPNNTETYHCAHCLCSMTKNTSLKE